jgi:hypothetical protein
LAFLVSVGADGFSAGFTGGARGVAVLAAIAEAWSVTAWSALDARARAKPYFQIFWLLTLATWPASSAVHLVRMRGKRGVLWYLACGLLAVTIYFVCRALGTLLGHA